MEINYNFTASIFCAANIIFSFIFKAESILTDEEASHTFWRWNKSGKRVKNLSRYGRTMGKLQC